MSVPERVWLDADCFFEKDCSYYDGPTKGAAYHGIPYRRESVCEWRKDEYNFYKSENHQKYYTKVMMDEWTFCPYCSGTIRIVGQGEDT